MATAGRATALNARTPREFFARLHEWLWRGAALRDVRARGSVRDALVAAQLDRAQAALAAAEKISAPEALSLGASHAPPMADALALSLYREAAYWALCAAAGGRKADDLEQAFALLAPVAIGSLPPEALPDARAALVERDFIASAALDAVASARDVRAAHAFVDALLLELGARELSELRLLRQRVLRVGALGALVLAGMCAAVLVQRRLRPDLAEHARWRSSTSSAGYPAEGRGGSAAAGELALFFHTGQEPSPWIEFDLGAPHALHSVRLVNRADCCFERAAPLVIELSVDGRRFREVARRDELFYDWFQRFDTQESRYLRVRALRRTMLHLTRVEIR